MNRAMRWHFVALWKNAAAPSDVIPVINFQFRIITRIKSLIGRLGGRQSKFRSLRHRRDPGRHCDSFGKKDDRMNSSAYLMRS